MNRFITNNDHISTSALYDMNYLSHGIQWGKHRYVRREGSVGNWRYIYPEDLKKAGQNLVSGTRNLVSKAANSVSRAVGVSQRQSYQRAEAERKKWSGRYHADNRFGGIYAHNYKGGFEKEAPYRQPSEYVTKNLNRAYNTADRARKEYQKTLLGKIEKAGEDIKDLPSDISYEINSFMQSQVGVGHRKKIASAREEYLRASSALRSVNPGSIAGHVAVSNFDNAYSDYRKAVSDYGKTFLGKCEKLLNTKYSKMKFK